MVAGRVVRILHLESIIFHATTSWAMCFRTEAGVRMAYIPKVSFKSKWQAAGKYHGCCQPRLCHAVCRYKHRSFFMPGMILSSCSWLLLCYKHDLTNKFLGTCVMPSWEMCGTCLDAVKASSRKMKATWKLPAIRGCRLQQSPWA